VNQPGHGVERNDLFQTLATAIDIERDTLVAHEQFGHAVAPPELARVHIFEILKQWGIFRTDIMPVGENFVVADRCIIWKQVGTHDWCPKLMVA